MTYLSHLMCMDGNFKTFLYFLLIKKYWYTPNVWLLDPDAPPEEVRPDESVQRQLSFRWQPPPKDDRNGLITQYEYEFDVFLESMVTEWVQNGTTNKTEIIFTELQHDTAFQFRVRARTSAGPGPFCNLIIATTLPRQLPNSKCFRIIKMQSHRCSRFLQWMISFSRTVFMNKNSGRIRALSWCLIIAFLSHNNKTPGGPGSQRMSI